jgi:sporulation protein YlmC with PRC-barrel domain
MDSDLTLPHSGDDIRWYQVVDDADADLGKVDQLLIDEEARRVRFLRVESGGFLGLGTTKVLVPVEAIKEIAGEVVRLKDPRDKIAKSPIYDPMLVDENYYASVYDYYGY